MGSITRTIHEHRVHMAAYILEAQLRPIFNNEFVAWNVHHDIRECKYYFYVLLQNHLGEHVNIRQELDIHRPRLTPETIATIVLVRG